MQTRLHQDKVVHCHALLLCNTGVTVAQEVVTIHRYPPRITSAQITTRLTWGLAETSGSTLSSVAIASMLSHTSCMLHCRMPWLVSHVGWCHMWQKSSHLGVYWHTHTHLFSYHGGNCYNRAVVFSEFWLAASMQHNSVTDENCCAYI